MFNLILHFQDDKLGSKIVGFKKRFFHDDGSTILSYLESTEIVKGKFEILYSESSIMISFPFVKYQDVGH